MVLASISKEEKMNIGISRDIFLADFFEKRILFVKGALLAHKVEWRDVDNALFSWEANDGLIQLHKNGLIPVNEYTENIKDLGTDCSLISKAIFYDYLKEGATLVLNRLDTKLLSIHYLTLEIAKFVGEKAVANGYIAFGGGGTFGKHWDTHDVFAVQLIGRKRWKVYGPGFQLPLSHQKSKLYKNECPAEPTFDEILEQGDVLYIPRGWWHEAIPLQEEETMHVAVGIHTLKVTDYLKWLCNHIAETNLDLRRTLKFESDGRESISDILATFENALADPSVYRAFKGAQAEQERLKSEFHLENISNSDKSDFESKSKFYINSVFKRFPESASNVKINGISMNLDAKSCSVLNEILASDGRVIDQSSSKYNAVEDNDIRALIDGLHQYDVIAKRSY